MSELPKHEQLLIAIREACGDQLMDWTSLPELDERLGWGELAIQDEADLLTELGLALGWYSAFGRDGQPVYTVHLLAAGLARARELTAAAVLSAAPDVGVQPPGLPTRPADRKRSGTETERGIVSFQAKSAGRPTDPLYDEAARLISNFEDERQVRQAFSWYCERAGIEAPDKFARDAFKKAMSRRAGT